MIKQLFTKGKIRDRLLTGALVLFALSILIPRFASEQKLKGIVLDQIEAPNLLRGPGEEKVRFPPDGSPAIAIFWASWCGPCKVEMNRLKSSVEAGKIPSSKIFAINPFEDFSIIRKFLVESPYPFVFIEAPFLARQLQVNSTPTTVFIQNGKIESVSTGMSLIGIWRAEWLFQQ